MGNASRKALLKEKDAKRYASAGFSGDELRALYSQFLSLKHAEGIEEPSLSLGEFQAAMGFGGTTSHFLERTFKLFDKNHDGLITFEEFIYGIALLTPNALPENKIRFTFQLYDLDGAGRISPGNLRTMLSSALSENGIRVPDSHIDKMVADTFVAEDLNRDGYIDYAEFKAMVEKSPGMMKPLTVNVNELISQGTGRENPIPV